MTPLISVIAGALLLLPAMPLGLGLPTGILAWDDAGVLLLWVIIVAFVGSLLGILHARTTGHRVWRMSMRDLLHHDRPHPHPHHAARA